jgi:ComF family protein
MLRRLLNGLKDIIYPQTCLACKNIFKKQNDEEFICSRCREKIIMNIPPFCNSCGRQLGKNNGFKNICPKCLKSKLYFDRAFSPCVYDGVIKELIHEFKYKGKVYLGKALSGLLIDFIREYDLPTAYLDCVIPVPLHKVRLREREFNQAQILGRYIADEFKLNMIEGTLVRCRNTKTQTEMDSNRRLINVKDSFVVCRTENVSGKNILLIDDVLTTGATSSEAALALKNSGANIVFVLTLAN